MVDNLIFKFEGTSAVGVALIAIGDWGRRSFTTLTAVKSALEQGATRVKIAGELGLACGSRP